MPIALPVGPTRRAEIRTSAPAPEPRSRASGSRLRRARRPLSAAPQPSDAATAAPGRRLVVLAVERWAEHLRSACVGVPRRCVAADGADRGRGVFRADDLANVLAADARGLQSSSRNVVASGVQQAVLSLGSQQVVCCSAVQQAEATLLAVVLVSSAMRTVPGGRRGPRSSRPTIPDVRSPRFRPGAGPSGGGTRSVERC